MPHKTKAPINEIIRLYNEGFSCEKIAKMFNMSRQAVWQRLKTNKVKLRKTKCLPFIMYDGHKFTIHYDYYRYTANRVSGVLLHRYKYEREVGKIPKNHDIHHIDENRLNNNIDNLECIPNSEHTKKHHTGYNQHKNHKTIKEGKYPPTEYYTKKNGKITNDNGMD